MIVLHAPPDEPVERIDQLLALALRPCMLLHGHLFALIAMFWLTLFPPVFLFYCLLITVFSLVMIYRFSPVYGRRTPLVYISICSTVGSISIMAIKAFGIALKLTLEGHNQFGNPSTYVFALIVIVCILVQMNYLNKALSQFSTSM